jgi:hypothetical protein
MHAGSDLLQKGKVCNPPSPKEGPLTPALGSVVQQSTLGLHTLEQYEPLIGAAAVERINR